ncbi:MAG: insulinase family protein [Actinobacteria bacterium]|nr:insulinase family protein [Actinomycetota bacterium]
MPPAARTAARTATKTPSLTLERFTLDNGLRVVVSPDRTSPVVAVAVYYDVGMRSEPEGRTGFAHLFEHMMFQGSASLGKTEHFTYVQGSGGTLNGSTHLDYTNYYEVLPSNATELALFLEADRMRSIALTQENLDNQVAVVQNEIRVNVQNRPYGGYPWLKLPPVLYDTFANTHDGYGSFVDLESATLEDAAQFFDRYYARATPERPSFSEPPLTAERREVTVDRLAPAPAVSMAWRTPDPADLSTFLPYVVLAEVLTDGDAARLQDRMLLRDRSVLSVGGYVGLLGDSLDARDPTPLIVDVHHPDETSADTVLATVDDEIARLVADGLRDGELERTVARMTARYLREIDPALGKAQQLAVFEQQRDRAELTTELPGLLAQVRPADVQAAAATLRPDNRAVLELRPGSDA